MSPDAKSGKPMMDEIRELHASMCSALADPHRIAMLYELANGPMNVTDLVAAMDMPQSSVSRHLRTLRDRQLVTTRRDGSNVYYELSDPEVLTALDTLRGVLRRRLEARAKLADAL